MFNKILLIKKCTFFLSKQQFYFRICIDPLPPTPPPALQITNPKSSDSYPTNSNSRSTSRRNARKIVALQRGQRRFMEEKWAKRVERRETWPKNLGRGEKLVKNAEMGYSIFCSSFLIECHASTFHS